MSGYFKRLIEQSGLAVPTPALPAPVPRATPSHDPPPSASLATEEVVEVDEQRIESVDAAPVRTLPREVTPPGGSAPESPQPHHTVADARGSDPATGAAAPPHAAAPASSASIPATGADFPRSSATLPHASQPPAEIPADVMQAVMNWIAAGTPGEDPPRDGLADASQPATPRALPPTIAAAAPAPPVPDRVIEIPEDHGAAATNLPVNPPSPPAPRQAAGPVEPAAPLRTPAVANRPMRVSIGSIEVVVQATPPPPSAAAPASSGHRGGPSQVAQPAASRATGFSKLRRHYIIPH